MTDVSTGRQLSAANQALLALRMLVAGTAHRVFGIPGAEEVVDGYR
jgi:hypothetical protein